MNLVGRTADGTGSAWVGVPAIDPSFEEMEREIWRRLDWGKRQIALDAGRYEVILPPSGVVDMMAELAFGGLGGQDAEDGRTVFSKEGDGTRVGETITTLPFTLSSDPFEPTVECTPFVATAASSSDVSVFDNGLPLGHIDWLRDGVLAHLRYHRAGAAKSGVAVAPYVDNLALRCRAARPAAARSTTWWPAPNGGSCSPACGTSGRSTRRPCSRPGSHATAST